MRQKNGTVLVPFFNTQSSFPFRRGRFNSSTAYGASYIGKPFLRRIFLFLRPCNFILKFMVRFFTKNSKLTDKAVSSIFVFNYLNAFQNAKRLDVLGLRKHIERLYQLYRIPSFGVFRPFYFAVFGNKRTDEKPDVSC